MFMHDMVLLRCMSRSEWYKCWRIIRKYHGTPIGGYDDPRRDESQIAVRARLYKHIDQKTVDGVVSLNQSGMDCDCVRATYGDIVPVKSKRAIEKSIDQIYQDAEGPQSVWIDFPDECVSYSSRDLIMEAYEDGHPHSVSEVRYENT
jgi:hypothetical protein